MQLNEMIFVMESYKKGYPIEHFDTVLDKWVDCDLPSWDFTSYKYRVKDVKDIPIQFDIEKIERDGSSVTYNGYIATSYSIEMLDEWLSKKGWIIHTIYEKSESVGGISLYEVEVRL